MIPSTFAGAKTSTRYTLANTLRHSLGTTQVQCPQYKRTSPVGQDTQKEERLTTDHCDGEGVESLAASSLGVDEVAAEAC